MLENINSRPISWVPHNENEMKKPLKKEGCYLLYTTIIPTPPILDLAAPMVIIPLEIENNLL